MGKFSGSDTTECRLPEQGGGRDNPLCVQWEPSPVADWIGFSRRDFVSRILSLFTLLLGSSRLNFSSSAVSEEACDSFRIKVIDKETGHPLPCTIKVVNSLGKIVLANEIDNGEVAKTLGLRKVFDLGYRNHNIEEMDIIELKARLIFLFRVLKVDTVLTFNP